MIAGQTWSMLALRPLWSLGHSVKVRKGEQNNSNSINNTDGGIWNLGILQDTREQGLISQGL